MDPIDSSRAVPSASQISSSSLPSSSQPQVGTSRAPSVPPQADDKADVSSPGFLKGPKRKRLAKACDACHKSKRRCDGTAPCSNCYYASKACTYTDASGRPVPAPRRHKLDRTEGSSDIRRTVPGRPAETLLPGQSTPITIVTPYGASFSNLADPSEDEPSSSRKRFRSHSRVTGEPTVELGMTESTTQSPPVLDPALTRELVNLFFTHCHPQRIIIHKPSFSSALSHNLVPSHLLHAVCALAAPLSKQPRIRTTPTRFAGRHFAQVAASIMFDGAGRLTCEPNLATAQALCLLQMHELVSRPSWSTHYHDLALQIVEGLGVHKPDNPTLTPLPSPEFIHASVERECVRRILWLIYLVDLMSTIYFKRSIPDNSGLRLPVDETSFELAVHSTLPEYMYLPAPRTQYASEFGHLIRVVSIYSKVESILDVINGSESGVLSNNALVEPEQSLQTWLSSLPYHLQYSEENLQVQLSMFETSSNTGAWCFCCMHVMHASCVLALDLARQDQRGSATGVHWAVPQLDQIISSIGSRARNSVILGAALWALYKYCGKDDEQVRSWSDDFEEVWGIRVQDLISVDWRPQPQLISQPRPIPHSSSIPISMSAPPSYSSLGRYRDEQRLRNTPGTLLPGDQDDFRRTVGDNDMEISPHNGLPRLLDGPQSLPSLKASGLLDSWNGPSAPGGGSATWMTSRSEPLSAHRRSPAELPLPSLDASRASTSGLPVGLPWLANESR